MVQIVNMGERTPALSQLAEGLQPLMQMSLQQKMSALEDKRKAQFHQQQVSTYAQNLRKLGGDYVPFANAYEATGGNAELAKMFTEYAFNQKEQESQTNAESPESYGNRVDNTKKGRGWLGPQNMRDNSGRVATELATTVNIDGKEKLIPSLVPTLSEEEKDHLLKGGKPTPEIIKKAVAHAQERETEGKDVFYNEDQNKEELPVSEESIKDPEDYARAIQKAKGRNFDRMQGPPRDRALKEGELKFNALMKKKEVAALEFNKNRAASEALLKKPKERIQTMINALPEKKKAVHDILANADKVGPFSQAHIATAIGAPELGGAPRSAFESGVKNFLKSSLTGIGGRANMFLEQKFYGALPMIGQEPAANLALGHGLQYLVDREEKEIELFNDLSAADEAKDGYTKPDITRRVQGELKKWDRDVAEKYAKIVQEDYESGKTFNDLMYLTKQTLPTPLTERREKAIMLKSQRELQHELNVTKVPPQALANRMAKHTKENNFYVEVRK